MDNSILCNYTERVYGYAVKRTYSREEAEELAQEILFTAIRQLNTLQDESRFEPWLWGIALNVTRDFKRTCGKQRVMFVYDALENLEYTDDYSFIDSEFYAQLRTRISQLSKIYRDIIVFYYYDNLSVKEISQRLNVPEGTTTWRLSEGRKKLKKECITMTETALKPIDITIRINGYGNFNGKDKPFPWAFVNDALSQNILYHCYIEAHTTEEISKLCGVPAYYIEDSVKNLLKREALIEATQNKYLTNFIIYGETHNKYSEQSTALFKEITEEYVSLLKSFTKKIIESGINTAGKNEDELCYLFGILSVEYLSKNNNPFPNVPYQTRFDGNEWTYHGNISNINGVGNNIGMGAERNLNLGSEGLYSHYSYTFSGFTYRPMMTVVRINVCEKLLNCIELTESEKEIAANLINEGYLKNNNGTINVVIPSFNFEQRKIFENISNTHFANFLPKYILAVKKYGDGYRKLFPKHLKTDVDRAMSHLFSWFFVYITKSAQNECLLPKPSDNAVCDVLLQVNKARQN